MTRLATDNAKHLKKVFSVFILYHKYEDAEICQEFDFRIDKKKCLVAARRSGT